MVIPGFDEFLSDEDCTRIVNILIDKGYLLERHSEDPVEVLVALEFHLEDITESKTVH